MIHNKLEISIEKDSKQNSAELESMNLEVAEAFLVLVQSLTKIIQNSPNKAELKIKVSKGSVVAAIEGNGLSQVRNDYLQVVHRESSDKAIVEPWRDLQKLIKNNGLIYKSILSVEGQSPIIFHTVLRESKTFIAKKRKKPSLKTQIKMFSGRLFQLGGLRQDNIHLETGDNTIIIDCTLDQAEKANQYFKKETLISAWLLPSVEGQKYVFCNSYYYDDLPLFKRFEKFVNEFENTAGEIESIERLHEECIYYLNTGKFRDLKKFLQLFNHESIHLSIIHTILMLLSPHRQNEQLKQILDELNVLFERKLLKLNRKPNIAIENSN